MCTAFICCTSGLRKQASKQGLFACVDQCSTEERPVGIPGARLTQKASRATPLNFLDHLLHSGKALELSLVHFDRVSARIDYSGNTLHLGFGLNLGLAHDSFVDGPCMASAPMEGPGPRLKSPGSIQEAPMEGPSRVQIKKPIEARVEPRLKRPWCDSCGRTYALRFCSMLVSCWAKMCSFEAHWKHSSYVTLMYHRSQKHPKIVIIQWASPYATSTLDFGFRIIIGIPDTFFSLSFQ